MVTSLYIVTSVLRLRVPADAAVVGERRGGQCLRRVKDTLSRPVHDPLRVFHHTLLHRTYFARACSCLENKTLLCAEQRSSRPLVHVVSVGVVYQ